MNPSHEEIESLLRDALVDAPYATRLERTRGGKSLVHIRTFKPVFEIRKELDKTIGFRIQIEFMKKYRRGLTYFRGVSSGVLQHVLENGVDANPFFAADNLEKALEYGGDFPLVLILDPQKIEPSFRVIYPGTEHHAEKLAAARLEFNSPGIFDDGTGQWLFSYFPETHRSRHTDYEHAYGWRLTGDPRDGLLALLLFEGVIDDEPQA